MPEEGVARSRLDVRGSEEQQERCCLNDGKMNGCLVAIATADRMAMVMAELMRTYVPRTARLSCRACNEGQSEPHPEAMDCGR